MSEESKKILEMLAEGKISVDEAERLLKALGSTDAPKKKHKGIEIIKQICDDKPGKKGAPRFLRVKVDSKDGDEVDVKLPLALVKAGLKLSSVMPKGTEEKLLEKGIDLANLAELNSEEFIEALEELEINVESGDGDEVFIYAE